MLGAWGLLVLDTSRRAFLADGFADGFSGLAFSPSALLPAHQEHAYNRKHPYQELVLAKEASPLWIGRFSSRNTAAGAGKAMAEQKSFFLYLESLDGVKCCCTKGNQSDDRSNTQRVPNDIVM